MRVGLSADAGDRGARRPPPAPPRRPGTRPRRVAGNLQIERHDHGRSGAKANPAVLLGDLVAEGAEHPLGVVAAPAVGLPQRDLHPAHHAGKEQAALDLGAGDRHLVRSGCRALPRMVSGSPSRPRSLNRAPIRASGTGDPAHRPAAKRAIAGERRGEAVPGQQAEQQPGGRAGVAAVEGPLGSAETPDAARGDHRGGTERADRRAELAQHPGGGPGIERGQRAAHVGGPARHRGEEQRAVGDALVSRDPNPARDLHRSSPRRNSRAAAR